MQSIKVRVINYITDNILLIKNKRDVFAFFSVFCRQILFSLFGLYDD